VSLPGPLAGALGAESAERVSGGCIHACFRARIRGRERFLKINDPAFAAAFAAEADGLAALRAAGASVPEPLQHGVAGGKAYLMLNYLELDEHGDFSALGAMLAGTHRTAGTRFGWHADNYIGTTLQRNAWRSDWSRFWREQRLQPQLELARRNGYRLEAEPVLGLIEGHRPQPALVHGDLWRGNVGFTKDGPVLFDPAVYFGDREVDLAMTELFGGFPAEFYSAYREAFPLEPGYESRKAFYNLYHLLNHLNLFGAGYLAQVQATLRLLLDSL